MPDFNIPNRARQEINNRPPSDEDGMIEFPPGSGVFAEYSSDERQAMRTLTKPEMELVHEMKVLFGGTLHSPGDRDGRRWL